MDERSILIAAFVGGALLQAIILIRADWNWLKIGVSIFISLGVVAVGSDKANYNQDQHIYLGLFFFAGLIAFLFKEDILPAVSEKLLLSYTLTFWFAFFVYYFKGTPFQIGILCICLLPTAATISLALKRTGSSPTLRRHPTTAKPQSHFDPTRNLVTAYTQRMRLERPCIKLDLPDERAAALV